MSKNMPRHQASDAVAERRLRPIYDSLDVGNFKRALQEADRVLKKQPNFQTCRVLKGLALLKLGKDSEALAILDEVVEERPVEDSVLQALTIAYRDLQKFDKIVTIYENASKQGSVSEEKLSHLFMAHVRQFDFKKQQITAMDMFKKTQRKPYYFWSVISLALQTLDGDERVANSVILPLANKMMQKFESEGKFEQEQETILYLLILEMRQDWKEALRVLDSPIGQKLEAAPAYQLQCKTRRLNLYQSLEMWPDIVRTSRNYLIEHPDQWNCYLSYITAVLKLTNDQENKENGATCGVYDLNPDRVDKSVAECEQLFERLAANEPKARGPKLAKLELYSRLEDLDPQKFNELPDLILNYVAEFGGKSICFSDIKSYLVRIPDDKIGGFLNSLVSRFSKEDFTSHEDINKDVCVVGIQRYCGQHRNMSNEALHTVVSSLIKKYIKCQSLVSGMETTELRPTDNYLLLASHILWDMWQGAEARKENGQQYFNLGIFLPCYGLISSPSNWQLKMMFFRYSMEIGCHKVCQKIHSTLDMKHLMVDTLGSLLYRNAFSSVQFEKVESEQYSNFYSSVPREITESIIQAYKNGNFDQLMDMYRLKQKIMNSHSYYLVETERQFAHLSLRILVRGMVPEDYDGFLGEPPFSEPVKWDQLRDNRDLTVMTSWDPPSQYDNEQFRELSFQAEKEYIDIRMVLLQAVYLALDVSEFPASNRNPKRNNLPNVEAKSENDGCLEEALMSNYIKQLELLYSNLQSKWSSCSLWNSYPPQSPARPRQLTYIPSQQIPCLLVTLRNFNKINCIILHGEQSEESSALKCVQEISKEITSVREKLASHPLMSSTTDLTDYGSLFSRWEMIAYCTETVSLLATVIGSIWTVLITIDDKHRRDKLNKFDGNKALKVPPSRAHLVPAFNQLVESIQDLTKFVLESAQRLKFPERLKCLPDELSFSVDWDSFQDCRDELTSLNLSITSAHGEQIREVKRICELKCEYLDMFLLK